MNSKSKRGTLIKKKETEEAIKYQEYVSFSSGLETEIFPKNTQWIST